MNIPELPFLPDRESNTVEFKTEAALEPISRTIAAFLNGRGGIVLVGFSDEGEMVGLRGIPG